MGISTYFSQHDSGDSVRNAEQAVADIKARAAGAKPAQIIYFADGSYDPARLAAAMREAFPDAVSFGCASGGEIIDGELVAHSVVAMFFGADVFEFFDIAVLHRLDANGAPNSPEKQVDEVFARFEEKIGKPACAFEHDKYVGIAFADGLRYYTEPVLERAGDLTGVPFIGGIAGDDGVFAFTPVFFNGEMFTDAVVLALAKPSGRFALVKTEGLEILDKTFVVTGADEPNRLVTHLDGVPAAEAYSAATGMPVETMNDFASTFSKWPFGLMAGDEPYLRVAVERLPDGSLRFLNAVKEGMRLKLARPADILDHTREAMAAVREKLGSISALLHINCISRRHELERLGQCEAFGKLFAGYPSAGFSSHGEFFIAIANQTSTMLVFA